MELKFILVGTIAFALLAIVSPKVVPEFMIWAFIGSSLTYFVFVPLISTIVKLKLEIREVTSFIIGTILLLMVHFLILEGDTLRTVEYILEWIVMYAFFSPSWGIIIKYVWKLTP